MSAAVVTAVSLDDQHAFSKPVRPAISLIAGLGVQGDAHAGRTVQHLSRIARDPSAPNLRQVHLIHAELHDELSLRGYRVSPGDMGENITTRGIDLLALPTGTKIMLGPEAVVEVTGLRNPCAQLDGLQHGLMKAVLDRDADGRVVRKAGVMAIVLAGSRRATGSAWSTRRSRICHCSRCDPRGSDTGHNSANPAEPTPAVVSTLTCVIPHPPAVLVLASGSQGRLRLLRGAGIFPEVVVSGVDESTDEPPDTPALVRMLAERKASAVAARRPAALVLGCDSMLDLDGLSLGKPRSPEEATDMWHRLAGREGLLCTGHCLIDGASCRQVSAVARTTVRFGSPTEAELAAYVASGEPLELAGAFTIDGRGAPFIDGIDGDPGNVIGVSLPLLRRMLVELDLTITDLWHTPASA
ncbi:MAG: Maf family nucleotide pyrophosphatase [Streptosporangiaceae bacterium]